MDGAVGKDLPEEGSTGQSPVPVAALLDIQVLLVLPLGTLQ